MHDLTWLTLSTAPPAGGVVLDGRTCRTTAGFHDTAAAALALPDWYGRNWDAFEECLADAAPNRLVITHAEDLLADEDLGPLGILLDILRARRGLAVTLTCPPGREAAVRARLQSAPART